MKIKNDEIELIAEKMNDYMPYLSKKDIENELIYFLDEMDEKYSLTDIVRMTLNGKLKFSVEDLVKDYSPIDEETVERLEEEGIEPVIGELAIDVEEHTREFFDGRLDFDSRIEIDDNILETEIEFFWNTGYIQMVESLEEIAKDEPFWLFHRKGKDFYITPAFEEGEVYDYDFVEEKLVENSYCEVFVPMSLSDKTIRKVVNTLSDYKELLTKNIEAKSIETEIENLCYDIEENIEYEDEVRRDVERITELLQVLSEDKRYLYADTDTIEKMIEELKKTLKENEYIFESKQIEEELNKITESIRKTDEEIENERPVSNPNKNKSEVKVKITR